MIEEEIMYDFNDKKGLLKKLQGYAAYPDDDNIRLKEKIKSALLHCPELLYVLNNKKLESELFDNEGLLLTDGEWDRYFGSSSNIRPFLFLPETPAEVQHYICYQINFEEMSKTNAIQKHGLIIFTILVDGHDSIDKLTGIPRHDLIASIISERFNWSNIFGTQCRLISNKETETDNNYLVRTLVFQITNLNHIIKTTAGNTSVINNLVRK